MYRGRPWTIRQYAGFASAEETNARFRYLLERGQTGLSVAFDLPTQLGYDSDDPLAVGEVGRTGVAIDSIADMELLLRRDPARRGLDLDDDQRARRRCSCCSTSSSPRSRASRATGSAARSRTTSSRSTSRAGTTSSRRGRRCGSPPTCSRTARERLPRWNTISISGYHIREAGSTAVQEVAFTLANGIAYCRGGGRRRASRRTTFGARLSFFFNAHNHFFQEVAKFRAARRLWARIMRERFGATNPRALALRFHAQTGGSTLTAQQPENNIVRVAVQALSAVCGGAQSLHTNAFDEALALPTERSARIALRTQQILAHEAGGHRHRRPARRLLLPRGADGRARAARVGADLAGRRARRRGRGDRAGVRPAGDRRRGVPPHDRGRERRARHRRRQPIRRGRGGARRAPPHRPRRRAPPARADGRASGPGGTPTRRPRALAEVRRVADGDGNLLVPMREALRARCTIGEICGALRELWGTYDAVRP